MKEKDIDRFIEIMAGLSENYSNSHLSKNGLKLRFAALQEFNIDQVSQAAITLVKTHKFNCMPTVADFIAAMGPIGVSIEDQAEIEAVKVLEFLRLHGRNGHPHFDDPTTKLLMSTRWKYLTWASSVTESDLKWWKMEFTRTYIAHHAGSRAGCFFPAMDKIRQLAQATAKSLPLKNQTICGA